MLCGSLDGRGVWGRMDTCVCMAESPCCVPETATTLLSAMLQYKIKSKKKSASQGSFPKPFSFLILQPSLHLSSFYTIGRDLELLHKAHSSWMYTVLSQCYRNKSPNSPIISKPGESCPMHFLFVQLQSNSTNID